MKGELDIMTPAMKVASDLMSIPSFDKPDGKLTFCSRKRTDKKIEESNFNVCRKSSTNILL